MAAEFNLRAVHRIGGIAGFGGKDVVFLSDEFAPKSRNEEESVLLVEARDGQPPGWVKDKDILAARDLLRGSVDESTRAVVPEESTAPQGRAKFRSKRAEQKVQRSGSGSVFGFWQTALFNGAVDLAQDLIVAPFNERSGLYMIVAGGVIQTSGTYAGRVIPGYDATSLNEAAKIVVTPELLRNWKLPSQEALTSAEILRRKKAEGSRRVIRMSAAAVAISIAAGGLYVVMSDAIVQRTTEANNLATQATQLEGKAKTDKKLKLAPDRYPDGESVVSAIAAQQLIYGTMGLKISWDDMLSVDFKKFTAISSPPIFNLTFPHSRLIRADGTMIYEWPRYADGKASRPPVDTAKAAPEPAKASPQLPPPGEGTAL